jgi:hypothetical protein
VVGDDSGNALDLSDLHLQFEVRNATTQTLKTATIRVYNLSSDTANTIQNEFTRVILSAGYEGNIALIFQGQIASVKHGKLNATDTFLEIAAQDGDKAYNFAVTNRTLAKGWTADDAYNAFLQDVQAFGITAGHKPDFGTSESTDALPCYGMTRDYLRTLADSQGCRWSIEDNKLNFVPIDGSLPDAVVVLKSDSGLIGTPTQTFQGIEIRGLLNPLIRAGGRVKIDNASLATMKQNFPMLGQQSQVVAGTDRDGLYSTRCVTHTGDTRGNDWYTNMICVAVDPSAAKPATGPTLLAVPDNG